MGKIRIFLLLGLFCAPVLLFAQNAQNRKPSVFQPPLVIPDTGKKITVGARDTNINHTSTYLTLRQCIDYAMEHQPALNRSLINVDIVHESNAVNLAGWLPQVTGSGNLVHYFQQQGGGSVTTAGGTTTTGRGANSFVPEIAVNQAIFSPTLFYYHRTAPLLTEQAKEATDSARINLVSSVTKSFYSVLLTLEQISILKEDTTRLGKNVRDTYHQYIGGIVDETDYEEATITLNNSKAQLKQANENVNPQFASLKGLMGYPPEQPFNLSFDTTQMMQAIHIDTVQQLRYENRIEFKELATQKNLQNELIHYYRFQWVPTVSAFFNYDLSFQNSTSYPTSYIGLGLSVPIFTGFARLHNEKKAQLQYKQLDFTQQELKSSIYTQYATALANYKSNYYNLQLLQRNVALAQRTYFVVELQYKSGIVAYLNVITAESNLITSEVNYLNALFQVLTNKVDLQKAMGLITY